MKRTLVIAVLGGFGIGGLVGASAYFHATLPGAGGATETPVRPVWTEVQWPFPMDEWGKGKAFRCMAADCGAETNLYVRAKIGFCNCKTGVADDEELERLSDFRLMGDVPAVVGSGRAIKVAWMNGRSRSYTLATPFRARHSALALAFNDRCDAIVATVLTGHDRPTAIEPGVVEFLGSKTIIDWATVALGL
ncbi:hypothetical protein [Tardiphaga sp.]|uniref:hypothetical protein n=1 Tax=Tardiphaga sp. TaxID=1926292 RepID=UPI002626316B|nr:hypothetical protein [Tardiphaga sp.]MDB5620274.1 hypothetical protein [Tardiphaga sp.]